MIDNLMSRPDVRVGLALLGFLLAIWLLYSARVVLYPFVIAFGIAYLFDPVIDALERKRVDRTTAIVLLLILFFSLLALLVTLVGPLVMGQIVAMAKNVPGYIESIIARLTPFIESIPAVAEADIKETLLETFNALGTLPLKVANALFQWIWSGLSSVMGIALAIVNMLIIPVAAFYLLKDFDHIVAGAGEYAPPRMRAKIFGFVKKIDEVLSAFVRGQLIVAMTMAVILSTGLFFIGTPMGILIGAIAGLANVVPYLSAVVGLAPALILTVVKFPGLGEPVLVLLLFSMAQALEGFVISPRVLEKAVGLHPVTIMASLLVGGAFFGLIGLLLAVPVAAVIKVTLQELDPVYRGSEFYRGGIINEPEVGEMEPLQETSASEGE